MIRKKTLAAALPTAKVLFFALYSKNQKKKEHIKTQIAPQPALQIRNNRRNY